MIPVRRVGAIRGVDGQLSFGCFGFQFLTDGELIDCDNQLLNARLKARNTPFGCQLSSVLHNLNPIQIFIETTWKVLILLTILLEVT